MANDYTGNPVVLDTFDAVINVANSLGFAKDTPLFLDSIHWTGATNGGTCAITDEAGGNVVFSAVYNTGLPIIKYFNAPVRNLCIAISGVTSGTLIITFK